MSWTEQKGEGQLSTNIQLSLLPNCGYSYLTLAVMIHMPWWTSETGLKYALSLGCPCWIILIMAGGNIDKICSY